MSGPAWVKSDVLVVLAIGAGIVVGVLVALLARRWPKIEAPQVSGETIAAKVEEHPTLAWKLRRHFSPKTETGIALLIAVTFAVAATVGIGVILAMIHVHTGLARWDRSLTQYAADHDNTGSTRGLKIISMFGGTLGVAVLAIVACIIEYVRRPSKALPLFLLMVILGQTVMSNTIKFIVERARPDIDPLTGAAGTSFPSGHSTAAAATFAALALVATRGRSRRTKIIAAGSAAGAAAAVAASRIFLGVHWFTDVVAGLLLGWGWFAVCSIVFGGRLLEFGRPLETAEKVADSANPVKTSA
jgi:membrane-associated phospholipid phosphatase